LTNWQMTMTEKNTIQEIGFFNVISSDNITRQIIISQNVNVNEFNVVVAAHKVYTLNTPDGEKVYRTKDSRFFLKEDGTVLKKVGYSLANNYSVFHSGRQSQ